MLLVLIVIFSNFTAILVTTRLNGERGGVRVRVRVMVFNATFNNIAVILWRSVLLVEETGVPAENYQPASSHSQTLSHNAVSSTPRHEQD